MKAPLHGLRSLRASTMRCLLLAGVLLSFAHTGQSQSIDSLEAVLAKNEGIEKINTHLKLAELYDGNDWEKSVSHAKAALTLANDLQHDSLRFESNFALSRSYLGMGDYQQARTAGDDALTFSFDSLTRGDALQNLGRVYEEGGEYQRATEYLLEAITIFQRLGNERAIANTYNSLSFVYRAMDQPEKAIEVLSEARTIYERIGAKNRVAGIIFNMGLISMDMKKYKEAIPLFHLAVQGLDESKEPQKFSSYYNNLSNCYQQMLKLNPTYYDSALYFGKKNLALKQQLKDLRGIANAHNGLAATYERASDYTHSYSHATSALQIADSLQLKNIKKNALAYLITAQIGLRKFDNLNDHFEEVLDVIEEINDETSSRTLTEMTTKYETEKKEAENQLLVTTNAQQSRLNLILSIGGGVLLVLLGLVTYFYRDKQKANAQLAVQNKQIESNLREKEALLREIHHRVKNNLQVISSLLNMQSYYLDDPRMINAIAEGQNRVKAMALIHQKLYQTEHLSEIDFQEYTEQLISHLATAFGQSGKNIRSAVNGSAIKLDIDTAIPLGLILNELITNAYKYAFNGVQQGSLKVDLTRDDSRCYHLRISDSGAGLPADFNEEKLNSLGLKLVRMLIEQLDGSLTISNEPGASFYIRFHETRLTA